MKAAPNPFKGYKPVPRAQFDASSQLRRSMIGKIKAQSKQLGICDDDYRAILLRLTGKSSSTLLDDRELIKILDELKAKGAVSQPKKAHPESLAKAANHPSAMKARALWISLYHLGAIKNPSEKGLETFAKRQLGCERLQWADQGQMYKLVEALKAMGARSGWNQSTQGANDGLHALKLIKMRLCEAILTKLKAKGCALEDWSLAGAAVQLCGFEKARSTGPMGWVLGDFDRVAKAFGQMLRESGGCASDESDDLNRSDDHGA